MFSNTVLYNYSTELWKTLILLYIAGGTLFASNYLQIHTKPFDYIWIPLIIVLFLVLIYLLYCFKNSILTNFLTAHLKWAILIISVLSIILAIIIASYKKKKILWAPFLVSIIILLCFFYLLKLSSDRLYVYMEKVIDEGDQRIL